MSIDTPPQVVSPASTSTSTSTSSSSTTPIPKSGDTYKEKDPDSETQVISPTPTTEQDKAKATEDPKPSAYNPATLLTTLLSPFTFSSTPSSSLSPAPPPPEPYYTPAETPLFKTLQKSRLTRTREKQLLRAAERDYNDPPPPPGLGDCCGSSCDPCVRDLWGEEIGVWRGRWGDRGVESDENEKGEEKEKGNRKGNDVKVKVNGNGNKGRKDLEW